MSGQCAGGEKASSMSFNLAFPRAGSEKLAQGIIKSSAEDFYVEELMQLEPQGEGEHVWLWLEKNGQNTEYVAKLLARFSGVREMDVGFSGLKDHWAVTRQWFSVYLGNKPEPLWGEFKAEGVSILKHARHARKLRRGEHQGNRFSIVVRKLSDTEALESALSRIAATGFPNYYGIQRFGIQGANLERGSAFFEGRIKPSRSQRSFYLSAARSYLFNLNLARVVESGEWSQDADGGPLYGDPQDGVVPLRGEELDVLQQHETLARGIHKNRLKLERRPYCVVPKSLSWGLEGDMLTLAFDLPTGVFATSLLSECMAFKIASGEV